MVREEQISEEASDRLANLQHMTAVPETLGITGLEMSPGCQTVGMMEVVPCALVGPDAEVILKLVDICKSFPGVKANDQVRLEVRKGEVHALLGENGAGKSTLMNILYGILQPDSGDIIWKGDRVNIRNPHDAVEMGIGMVHQHFQLIPALSVVENIILSSNKKGVLLNKKDVTAKIMEISERYNLQIGNPDMKIWDLTVGQQQRVEIIKALYKGCDLLILDEPTSVLTPQEADDLFVIIRQLVDEGATVIFISHKLREIFKISDRITVLRNGHTVATVDTCGTDNSELACFMVGQPVLMQIDKTEANPTEPVLEIDQLTVATTWNPRTVDNLSLTVRAGEIYGIAGVDGNGQSELVQAILSILPKKSGIVKIGGKDVTNLPTKNIFAYGVGHIPEDRLEMAVADVLPIFENTSFYTYDTDLYCKRGLVDWNKEREACRQLITTHGIVAANETVSLRTLSGGNQQKVVVARELEKNPKLLLAVYPTRGVDIGATESIRQHIVTQRDNGSAILLISTELDEVMSLSDRIGVMYEGKILGEFDAKEASVAEIGLLMAGHTD